MHLLAYLFGLSYYVAVPITLLPDSAFKRSAVSEAADMVRQGRA
jgi:hypothetical protein